jgi:mono/diheme cytochrome c family protein
MPRFHQRLIRLTALLATACGLHADPSPPDFARDIQPILSDNCYQCHGPGESSRKGGLRLDVKEGAYGTGKSGKTAIAAGRSGDSELARRITTGDPDDLMPPPESNRKLTPAQIDLLKRWIDGGARWGMHWAFVPPVRPEVPAPGGRLSPNPIDGFVRAKLAESGRDLSMAADPARLLRRVTLDLTGLPPAPDELDAFAANPSPAAYAAAVDRLMASPRHGERLATEWLDIARYADTHGFQMDRYRPMWPWRDWVISAFNRNLPFDQFVLWQLAGDLLPGATREQRLATAFNRLHLQNEEGGIVEEEFRVSYVVDRVNTFGTAFLGMTFECSRCHDHKYDPISQRDFYSLFAFFQNIDESGQTTYFTDAMPVPALLLPTPEQERQMADLTRRIHMAEAALNRHETTNAAAFDRWVREQADRVRTEPLAVFDFDERIDGRYRSRPPSMLRAVPADDPVVVPGRFASAVGLSGDNGFTVPGLPLFSRADAFSVALWLRAPERAPHQVVLHHSIAGPDAGSRGYELLIENGRLAVGLHHMWPGNSLKVRTAEPIPTNAWAHVAFTYDGSSRATGLNIYVNGAHQAVEVIRDGLTKDITYERGDATFAVGFRFRDTGFKGGAVDQLEIHARELGALEVAESAGIVSRSEIEALARGAAEQVPTETARFVARGPGEPASAARAWLRAEFDRTGDPVRRPLSADLAALRLEQARLVNPIPEAMVMQELRSAKPAFVLKRGAYDAPGDAVTADTPHAIGVFPAEEPRNRLGLARWLLDPANPLMARVTVNRAWQMFFGRGLVETADNFGLQGALPSHPELLDWLATTFARGDAAMGFRPWDYRALCRLIVTSDTYRQTSRASAEELAADPENIRLARGPARRLTAEMLRDQALFVSGLLHESIGGPSVKPYQPDGLWEVAMGNPKYDRSQGRDLYRRSLYTFWKRTVPPPSMVTLDAAERNVCVARRQSTSTPLQALALLNDTQIVEAARFLGHRMLQDTASNPAERVARAFQRATGRRPTAQETSILERLFREQESLFEQDPEAARKLLAVGDSRTDDTQPVARRAAATVLATALLNHDEALMRR